MRKVTKKYYKRFRVLNDIFKKNRCNSLKKSIYNDIKIIELK